MSRTNEKVYYVNTLELLLQNYLFYQMLSTKTYVKLSGTVETASQ